MLVCTYLLEYLIKKLFHQLKYEGGYNLKFFNKVFLSSSSSFGSYFYCSRFNINGNSYCKSSWVPLVLLAQLLWESYRLYDKKSHKFTPSIISILSLLALFILVLNFDLNIKTIDTRFRIICNSY